MTAQQRPGSNVLGNLETSFYHSSGLGNLETSEQWHKSECHGCAAESQMNILWMWCSAGGWSKGTPGVAVRSTTGDNTRGPGSLMVAYC